MKTIFIYLALFFFSLSFTQAHVQKNEILEKFKLEKKVSNLLINKKGIPSFIKGNLSTNNSEATALKSANVKEDSETKTFRFFNENRELFRMKDPDNELKVSKNEVDELGMSHVQMTQMYQGVEVYGAELIAHYTPTGELNVINGEYQDDINVPVTPKVTSPEAESIVLSKLSIMASQPESLNSKLIIYQFNEVYYLCWFVQVSVEKPAGRWEYFINAGNGEVIYSANRIMFNQNDVNEKSEALNNTLSIKQFQSSNNIQNFTNNLSNSLSESPNLLVSIGDSSVNEYSYNSTSHQLDISTTIGNEGPGAAKNFRIGFYLTIDFNAYILVAMASQSSLPAGGRVIKNVSVDLDNYGSLPNGNFYLVIYSDDLFQEVETNENDNGLQFLKTINYNRVNYSEVVGTGTGVMGDTKNHIDTYGQTGSFLLLDRTRRANNNIHNHNGQMLSDQSIETRAYPNLTTTNDDNNLWNSSSQAPAVDAHVYAGLVYDYLLTQFGRNSFDNKGSSMLSIVDDNSNGKDWANNAYWDGRKVNYTIVTSGNRSNAGALDVVGHEWAHAITDNESKLIYNKESGALDEAFSDMLGIALSFSSGIDPDWQIGENSYTDGHADRDLSNPHLYHQPDTYLNDPYWKEIVESTTPSENNDYCWVHYNSGVPNKMFYLLSEGGTQNGITVTGIGISNAIKIMYRANAKKYWTQKTDFINAKQGCISAANDLDKTGDWAIQTRNAWEAVNVGKPISPEATLALGEISGAAGKAVSIPVTANKLSDAVEFQFTIVYDKTILEFVSCSNWSRGINADDVTVTSFPNDGKITFYYKNSAINIENGKFFDLNFTIKKSEKVSSILTWSDVPTFRDSRNNKISCIYSDGHVINDKTVSTDFVEIKINVYPIPATNQLTVTNVENSRISVIDMFGRSVLSVESNSSQMNLDLTNLISGTYILKINKNNEIITRKISVVK